MKLSVILPTFNEAGNISKLIREINRERGWKKEFIVIDDDSPDGTAEEVKN